MPCTLSLSIAVSGEANFAMHHTGLTVGGFIQPSIARNLIEILSNDEKGLCLLITGFQTFQILKYICIDSYLLCLCWMLSRNVGMLGIQFVNSLLPTMFPMKHQLGLKSFNTSEVMFFCAGSAPQDGRQLVLY